MTHFLYTYHAKIHCQPIFANLYFFFLFFFFFCLTNQDGFMHKPFKLSTLMDVIEEINDGRKQVNRLF